MAAAVSGWALRERLTGWLKAAAGAASSRPPMPTGQMAGSWFGGLFGRRLPGTNFDFETAVGDPTLNSVVSACLRFITEAVCAARPRVVEVRADGTERPVPNHPLAALFENPNPSYSFGTLQGMVLRDLLAGYDNVRNGGNGYVQKTRAGMRETAPVKELHYLPAKFVSPEGPAGALTEVYCYQPGLTREEYSPRDVVHFRWGIDPSDMRRGRSPLYACLKEIAADNEASTYSASILRNGGVPPVILSPKEKDLVSPFGVGADGEAQKRALKQQYREATTGDRRGEALMTPFAIDVNQLAFNPEQMDLSAVRATPEERICAVYGVAPIVAHLGAGLKAATYSNYEQAIQSTIDFAIVPLLEDLAREWTRQLLHPDFEDRPNLRVAYDTTKLPSFADDRRQEAETMGKLADAASKLIAAGYDPEEVAAGLKLPVQTWLGLPAAPAPDPQAEGGGAKSGMPPFTRRGRRKERPEADADLYRAVEKFRAGLRRSEAGAVRAMAAALKTAEAAIRAAQDALIERMEEAVARGETINLGWLMDSQRYRELLEQVREAYAALAEGGAPAAVAEAQAAAIEAATGERLGAVYRAALGPLPEGMTEGQVVRADQARGAFRAHLPVSTIEALVGFAGDGSPLADLIAEIAPKAQEAFRAALVGGVALGKNPREIARDLAAQTGIQRNRALTIARTETLRAAREASREAYAANADVVAGWVWLSALDLRSCPICWAMHGSEHGTGERMGTHPSCRCTMVPRTKSWAELLGDDTLPDTRPQVESGEAVLSRLTEEQQRHVLGPERWRLWVEGMGLSEMVDLVHDERWGAARRLKPLEA